MNSSKVSTSVAVPVLLVLSVGGCGDSSSNQHGRSAGSAQAVPIEVIVLKPRLLENKINTTGSLLANEEVELRSEISGRIIGVQFEEGGTVKKGALLLKTNDRELKAQLVRKESEENIAANDERRKQTLLESGAISQEEYDKSASALKIVQAEREVIASQIAKTEIRAPFDGVIGLRHISEGGYVTPSMLVATMQDTDPIKAEFSVPEKYVRLLRSGLAVMVHSGESPVPDTGIIYAVESKIDPATRTIKARARIPNPDGRLIPGAFARIELTLEALADAIVVPAEAVIPQLSGETVFICQNGSAKSVSIKTGLRTEREIQVTAGLSHNDTLIVTGLMQLSDGKRVRIATPSG